MCYTQDDDRLKPVPLGRYPWVPLGDPADPTAIVKVSMIPTSTLTAPLDVFTPLARKDDTIDSPCWSFLIEKGDEALLWDMGLRAVST
jgi:hypothetical protein